MTGSVQSKMTHGAIWMVLFKTLERSIGLISTLILVRFLAPEDFGIVAMALSFVAMAELLTAFGFDIALIHRQDADDSHYNTAWTMQLSLGLGITLLMVGVASPIADFYKQDEVFWVICALSLGPFIRGLENIGVVAFRKDLDFRKEFWFQLSRKIFGFMVTVPLALWMQNYWALVIGTLASRTFATAYSYYAHPFRPRLSIEKLANLFHFSKWLLINNIVGFLKERLSDFFIGRLHGAASLGLYKIGYEFAHLPSTELSAPINRALLPGFAKMSSELDALREAYNNAIKVLALLTVPAAAGIFAVAPYMVPVVLGEKWLATTPLLEVLTFNGAILLFHSSMCTLLIAIGFPRMVAKINGVYVVILLVSLVILAKFGAIGAAYAALLTTVLSTPVYTFFIKKNVGLGLGSFIRAASRPVLASFLMIMSVRYAFPEYADTMSTLNASLILILSILLGAVVYIACIVIFWLILGRPKGAEELVYNKVRMLVKERILSKFSRNQ